MYNTIKENVVEADKRSLRLMYETLARTSMMNDNGELDEAIVEIQSIIAIKEHHIMYSTT